MSGELDGARKRAHVRNWEKSPRSRGKHMEILETGMNSGSSTKMREAGMAGGKI